MQLRAFVLARARLTGARRQPVGDHAGAEASSRSWAASRCDTRVHALDFGALPENAARRGKDYERRP
jgi:hypothetical protein